jgi:D-cysteine desulfhydrase
MDDSIRRLQESPRVEFGAWPTPVTVLDGGRLLVKRDDLTGYGRGGVKTRKIETVIGHMQERGLDSLVTTVGNITNLAHDVVPALASCGMTGVVVACDTPRLPRAERERRFAGLDSAVRFAGPSYAEAAAVTAAAFRATRAEGRRPFFAPPSLAHPAGVSGAALGYLEMIAQLDELDVAPLDEVFITASSGTTVAGFLLAENLRRRSGARPVRITAVQVYPGRVRAWILALVRWTELALRLESRLPGRAVVVDPRQLHGGFGHFPEELASLCARVRDETGIAVDPVFGGKTWAAMESARATADVERTTLYWHCGYTPDWESLDPLVNGAR